MASTSPNLSVTPPLISHTNSSIHKPLFVFFFPKPTNSLSLKPLHKNPLYSSPVIKLPSTGGGASAAFACSTPFIGKVGLHRRQGNFMPLSYGTNHNNEPESVFLFSNRNLTPNSVRFTNKKPQSAKTPLKFHPSNPLKTNIQSLSFLFLGFPFPLSSFASEELQVFTDQSSSKINLESILVSIDDFFNRYPFFVPGVVFIWLFVIPATQEYLRKYKFISAIDAFKKLKEDPNAQLLDIRDNKTLRILGSPNLKILNKNVLQVDFRDGDDEDFVKKVKETFEDPANTTVCIIDNFDGDSMKVAELLFYNGFKEAYAIRGGVRGNNGWLEIQETLLPPSVHIYPKTKARKSKQVDGSGANDDQGKVKSEPAASVAEGKQTNNGSINNSTSTEPNASSQHTVRSSSPYSMYPDMKPPSSPTPSKPQ